MIKLTRNDEKFNLDTVSNEELFEGLKGGIVSTVKEVFPFRDINESNLSFVNKRSSRRSSLGADGNLYPTICLATYVTGNKKYLSADATVILTPFEVKMAFADESGLQTLESDELTEALTTFMNTTFPDGDYENKLHEYQENEKRANKFYDDMVFGR